MKQKDMFPIEFTIEDGIDIPKTSKPSKWNNLPIEQMKVGQNVLLARVEPEKSDKEYKRTYLGVRLILKERQKDMRFKMAMLPTKEGKIEIRLFRTD